MKKSILLIVLAVVLSFLPTSTIHAQSDPDSIIATIEGRPNSYFFHVWFLIHNVADNTDTTVYSDVWFNVSSYNDKEIVCFKVSRGFFAGTSGYYTCVYEPYNALDAIYQALSYVAPIIGATSYGLTL